MRTGRTRRLDQADADAVLELGIVLGANIQSVVQESEGGQEGVEEVEEVEEVEDDEPLRDYLWREASLNPKSFPDEVQPGDVFVRYSHGDEPHHTAVPQRLSG